MLTALDQVKGDLSGGQKAFRDALTGLKLDTPTGPVTLDKNRNGIAYNFLTEVAKADDGHLYNKVVKVVENVNQTLGMPEDQFMALGPVGRDNPSCP
jgi:branched-chain amino acid transport system substrate-binding protein